MYFSVRQSEDQTTALYHIMIKYILLVGCAYSGEEKNVKTLSIHLTDPIDSGSNAKYWLLKSKTGVPTFPSHADTHIEGNSAGADCDWQC